MASQTTAMTVYSVTGDKRICTLPGHTVAIPRICIETRDGADRANAQMVSYAMKILRGCVHPTSGEALQNAFADFRVRFHKECDVNTEVDYIIATTRDIVTGDEWAESVRTLVFNTFAT
jgi:hypothetical protein